MAAAEEEKEETVVDDEDSTEPGGEEEKERREQCRPVVPAVLGSYGPDSKALLLKARMLLDESSMTRPWLLRYRRRDQPPLPLPPPYESHRPSLT